MPGAGRGKRFIERTGVLCHLLSQKVPDGEDHWGRNPIGGNSREEAIDPYLLHSLLKR